MAKSRPTTAQPPDEDRPTFGPSDSSDSGSDLIGQEYSADVDPDVPVDVAVREDARRPGRAIEAPDSTSDAAGTGERRSAAGDADMREGVDISPDSVIDTNQPIDDLDDEEDDEQPDDGGPRR